MPGTRVTYHSGHAHLRARAWGGVSVVGGNPGSGGRARSGPCRRAAAGAANGPRARAAGARALGLWSPGNLVARDWSAVQIVTELEAHYANYE